MNKIEELQKQIEDSSNQIADNRKLIETEEQKGSEANQAIIASARENIAMLEADEKRAIEQIEEIQFRAQAQEDELQEIVLPYDFNDIFDSHSANDLIAEVIKEFQRDANAKHNAEISAIREEHAEQLRAGAEREIQLQRQNREKQTIIDTLSENLRDTQSALDQANFLGKDAEQKRDAAVREKEGIELLLIEKQAEIDQLRQEKANAPAPMSAIEINGTSKADQIVDQIKTSKVKTALELALEGANHRGKVTIQPPEMFQAESGYQFQDNSETEPAIYELPVTEETENVNQFRTEDIPATLGQPMDQESPRMVGDPAEEKAITREEFDELKEFVMKLNLHEDGSVSWNRDKTGWVEVA